MQNLVIYALPTNNTVTPDQLVINISQNVPIIPNILLVTIFLVIALSGYMSKSRREGSEKAGNLPMWFAIAGLITSTGSFILFLADGIVNITTVITCFSVTILSCLWYLFSDN